MAQEERWVSHVCHLQADTWNECQMSEYQFPSFLFNDLNIVLSEIVKHERMDGWSASVFVLIMFSVPSGVCPCRLSRYQQFKDFQRRILVATNLFGRGMDIERVNIVFNYDMPEDSDTYLHRVSVCVTNLFMVHFAFLLVFLSTSLYLRLHPSGCPCRSIWNQRSGHNFRVWRDWRQDPEWRAGPLWGQRGWAARRNRHLLLQ